MSIFSRLFNKNAESDGKEPVEEDSAAGSASAEKKEGPRMRTQSATKQNHLPNEGKGGTMRPVAPSLQINPPSTERAGASSGQGKTSTPAGAESKPSSPAAGSGTSPTAHAVAPQPVAEARAGQAPEPGQASARGRPLNRATARLGSNATAPAYATPPAQGTTRPRQSSRPPKGERAMAGQAASGSAAMPARGGASGKASADAVVSSPKSPTPQRTPVSPLPDVPGAPLTLEFGSSLDPVSSRPAIQAARAVESPIPPAHTPAVQQSQPRSYVAMNEIDNVKLLNDLDEAFGAIVESANGVRRSLRPSEQPPPSHSITELKELFSALAANHMQQVRDFMIGVRWGEAPRDWVPICEPAIVSLVRAAKEMDLPELLRALENYRDALRQAADATGTTIAGQTRDDLILAYAKLTDLMPEAFGLDGERGRREAIIVHALLQQVPEVRKVTIDKIYAAGLSSLDNLFLAKPDEIAATTGMSEGLASRIVEKVQRYRQEIASMADATRTSERKHLGKLAAELRQLHQQFEAAASAWSEDAHARKKELRQARAVALLQVKVLLARLGEVDRLNQLERLPFERKIEELEEYLREAGAAKAPA